MNTKKIPVISAKLALPFTLITFCFALWGFANDITNPLVKAFGTIFNQSAFISSFVQFTFYGGYCFMAIPAAIYIKKYSYKSGILVGLALYALGGILFIPASLVGLFWPFCAAFFIMTCGLSFLETSANPFILAMGDEATATQRLNLAQSFNPMGTIIGILVAKEFILGRLDKMSSADRSLLGPEEFNAIKMSDLAIVRTPYVAISIVLIIVLILILITKMPKGEDKSHKLDIKGSFSRLIQNIRYREGVLAQAFYVGAQITVWTFTIHYGTQVLMDEGMIEAEAATEAVMFNFYASLLFGISRFICTFLLKYLKPGTLLMYLAIGAVLLIFPVMFMGGRFGLYSLVGISGCMSLMFPTIYGIALTGVGEDAKLGAAGLVMAIAGGSILPPLQGLLVDNWTLNFSFLLPLICFLFVALYGYRVHFKYGEGISS
ncbi:L-fucose:H+ symporter permease [Flexithrix dorotheae]|uniref:L-fucose:H+ symporter permease n=1 Tax=Flexithrix dorotheae TaxID=70993 RepID=UPI00039EABA6|nr:L-fucose:H+ symporter permease [Flexithrix dorotheae]